MSEAARVATDDDVPALADLARAAIAELAPTRGGDVFAAREARGEPLDEGFKLALADPDARVVAGTLDGVVIGYALARVERLRDGGHLGVVGEIFVDPRAREVGVGEAMINDVIGWCRDAGCVGVDSFALPGNRLTKNFFETFGFTARLLVMHHRLRDDGPGSGEEGEASG